MLYFAKEKMSDKHEKYINKENRLTLEDLEIHCLATSIELGKLLKNKEISEDEFNEAQKQITLYKTWAYTGNYIKSNINRINDIISQLTLNNSMVGYRYVVQQFQDKDETLDQKISDYNASRRFFDQSASKLSHFLIMDIHETLAIPKHYIHPYPTLGGFGLMIDKEAKDYFEIIEIVDIYCVEYLGKDKNGNFEFSSPYSKKTEKINSYEDILNEVCKLIEKEYGYKAVLSETVVTYSNDTIESREYKINFFVPNTVSSKKLVWEDWDNIIELVDDYLIDNDYEELIPLISILAEREVGQL